MEWVYGGNGLFCKHFSKTIYFLVFLWKFICLSMEKIGIKETLTDEGGSFVVDFSFFHLTINQHIKSKEDDFEHKKMNLMVLMCIHGFSFV